MLKLGKTYQELYSGFEWRLPDQFNIAYAVCDRHTGQDLSALFEDFENSSRRWTFDELSVASRRLANALAALGLRKGDVAAIILPQSAATLIAHLAIYRIGAIALPLFSLFGSEAIIHRLQDSSASVLITNDEGVDKISTLQGDLPALRHIISTGAHRPQPILGWDELMSSASENHTIAQTKPSDPALLQYTSGTTGKPKGVLHAHHVLLGILPGVELSHNFLPQAGDIMWTPADWAWGAGLLATLLPSLYHKVPVVARRFSKFDPELAADLMVRQQVRNAFLPPTALRMMRQSMSSASLSRLKLRSITSGGERLGDEMLAWGQERLGVHINEIFGQTEANLVVFNSPSLMSCPVGSMGRAVPGHQVSIVDTDGTPLPPGNRGIIAVRAPDPVMFLGYFKQPEATNGKFRNGWLLTGDVGDSDAEGNLFFRGRDDDIISSAGYRIGPDEVENCILQHPAVSMVAVVGVPDDLRGEIVKAFVVPAADAEAGPNLERAIQAFVKQRLSPHEYPREIEFRSSLPLTITGKVMRRSLREEEANREAGPADGNEIQAGKQ